MNDFYLGEAMAISKERGYHRLQLAYILKPSYFFLFGVSTDQARGQVNKILALFGILSAAMTGCDQGYSSRLAAREVAQKWSNQGRDYQYLHTPCGTMETTLVTAKMRFIRLVKLTRQYIG